jgi:hypothetical protein
VRAQAFGVPSFPVDTHIHRCALRWGLTDRLEERDPNKVSAALRRRFPEASWNKLHLQMIFMGREHCVAKNHSPSLCPICCWVNNDKGGHVAAAAGGKGTASFSSSSPSSPSSPSPASPSAGAPKLKRQTNSPKKHKGIIFYSDRKLELAASPHLVVDDTPAAVAASTAAAAAASAAAPSAAPEATKKKRGRLF